MIIPEPPGGFVVGQDIGVDVLDDRALRFMRLDSRFEEIV